jgi:hypothetical protein
MNEQSEVPIPMRKIMDAFEILAERWGLTREESAQVLEMTIDEYEALLASLDETDDLEADQPLILKIHLLISTHRALRMFTPDGAFNHCLNHPYVQEPLCGMSIKQFLITNNDNDSLGRLERWANSMVV